MVVGRLRSTGSGISIELVLHEAYGACIRVKRIVHFAGGRSLSRASQGKRDGAQTWGAQLRQRCLKNDTILGDLLRE